MFPEYKQQVKRYQKSKPLETEKTKSFEILSNLYIQSCHLMLMSSDLKV